MRKRTYIPLPEELRTRVEALRKARFSTTAGVIREALHAGLGLLERRDQVARTPAGPPRCSVTGCLEPVHHHGPCYKHAGRPQEPR